MKYTIHIDPNIDGQEMLENHLHAQDMAGLLHALSEEMRAAAKHEGDVAAGKWRERLYALAADWDVTLK